MTYSLLSRPAGRGPILLGRANRTEMGLYLLILLTLAQFFPPALLLLIPILIRRLHDVGVSGHWAARLALFGPAGWLALLWLSLLPGDSGTNPYGRPGRHVSRTTSLCTITSACG